MSVPDKVDCSPDVIVDFKHQFQEEVKYCGELLQQHRHKAVCYKYDHVTCHFQFPHEYFTSSLYDKETKSVILACWDAFVNYFNDFILVFC